MTDRTPVLIVGAGPAGMAAAATLRRLGVGVRIVDAAPGVATGSRAIMLWPPALRALGALGLLAELEARADRPQAFAYHLGRGRTLRVRVAGDNAPLVVPQQVPGELLDAELTRLGCPVERGVRVVAVTPGPASVTVETRDADGTAGKIEADWLIGADGVRSTVREQLGIGFAGADDSQRYLLAEGRIDGDVDRSMVHYFLGAAGVMLFAPLPGGDVRVSTPVEATEATPELVERLIRERGPAGVRMPEPTTLTTFTSSERIVARLRDGRCFLVGDAAHVHSAIGGQGLGLGLEDVRNLAWKLAGVVHDRLDPSVLDTYDPERRAAIEHIMKITGRMTKQAVLGPAAVRVRNGTLRTLHALGVLERVNLPMLAGHRVRLPDVLSGRTSAPAAKGLPGPGERAPSWAPAPASDGRFLLVTGGSLDGAGDRATEGSVLVDHAHADHAHADHEGDAALLLRPDGFVAASGRDAAAVTAMVTLVTALAG
jgi:2-polyprenyl-6-methoxyphenol hydroxylase-like FAD-dependent oxidoreductase